MHHVYESDFICSIGDLFLWLDGRVPSRWCPPAAVSCCLFHASNRSLASAFTRQYTLVRHLPATSYARGDSTTLEAAGESKATCAVDTSPSNFGLLFKTCNVTFACTGLAPSAVLIVEFLAARGSAWTQGSASNCAAASARSPAANAVAESWPSWILRLGLTIIMLPIRAVGMLFGQQQSYEPLPQAPVATAGAASGVGAPRGAARRERQVEFYNGEL